MPEPAEDIEPFLATVAEMMAAESMMVATDLLKTATFRSGETGYDNWNGGTSTYTVFLEVDPARPMNISCSTAIRPSAPLQVKPHQVPIGSNGSISPTKSVILRSCPDEK